MNTKNSIFNEAPTTSTRALEEARKSSEDRKQTPKTRRGTQKCEICYMDFNTKTLLKKHMDIHLTLDCDVCARKFKTLEGLTNHKKIHQEIRFCNKCEMEVGRLDWGHHLRTRLHKGNSEVIADFSANIKLKSSDFMERIEVFVYTNPHIENVFVEEFFADAQVEVLQVLEEALQKQINFKCNFELECVYIKNTEESQKMEIMSHSTKMRSVARSDKLENIYLIKSVDLKTKMSEFQERDSGWALHQISNLNININKHSIIRGSSFITLPYKLMKLNACLNIKNNDIYCFKWCVIAALRSPNNRKKPSLCSSYDILDIESSIISLDEDVLDFTNLNFPLDLKDITKFESQNPGLSINVFGYDSNGDQIVGPYRTCEKMRRKHISLLLLENDDCSRRHYVLIKNLSR